MPIDNLIRPKLFQSDLHKSYFLTVGRSLAVAQHFESGCRGITAFLEIKREVYSGKISPEDEGFDALVEKKLKPMLGEAVKKLRAFPGCPTDLSDLLTTAKVARNRIAHVCTISAFDPLLDEEAAVFGSLESLLPDVRTIAAVDAFICRLTFLINEGEPLDVPRDYVAQVVGWVFEEFEGEDFLFQFAFKSVLNGLGFLHVKNR